MTESDITANVLAISSILVGLLAFASKDQMLPMISGFFLFIALYYLTDTRKKLNEQNEELKKINEKIKIHSDLIDLKASVKSMEKVVFKK